MLKWLLNKLLKIGARPIPKETIEENKINKTDYVETNELETDLEIAKSQLSWFFQNKKIREKRIDSLDLSENFKSFYPSLFHLINKSRITELYIGDEIYRMYVWDTKESNTCGWVCKIGIDQTSDIEIIDSHQELLNNMGGIQERWDEFDELEEYEDYTINQNFLFTKSLCRKGIGYNKESYLKQLKKRDLKALKNFDNLLCFAVEANGNLTLYDIETKEIFLYASDHNFKYVEEVQNQPEYSFYKIKGIVSFEDYVEKIANEWTKVLTK